MFNDIPKDVRTAIFDEIRIAGISWHGDLPEPDFLGRIYGDLSCLSWNGLEDPYWIFSDYEADLLNCSDSELFRFLSLMLHPAVRSSYTERGALLEIFNRHLEPYGYRMTEESAIGGKPTYAVEPIEDVAEEEAVPQEITRPEEPKEVVLPAKREPKPGTTGEHEDEYPKAFISYSWDSEDHKAWVRSLAERLVGQGVDVVLDHWDLGPGKDIAVFIERSIRENKFILAVCTPNYKIKSENREGGAGYEGTIITGEIFKSSTPEMTEEMKKQIIPIWREGEWEDAAPPWLVTKDRIDLREDDDAQFERMLRAIHDMLPKRPPIGPKPNFD
ncbi:MAG: TIR domain-containing protein [Actinobacteria bacterium]|nr:TIR domain-containing protein [Actinomycetota bacterium]